MKTLFEFALTAFVTLFVVVDPFGIAPLFVALTHGATPAERREILQRGVLIAGGIALFFLFAGNALLRYLGVTLHAFGISGGILLFVMALPMLFGQRAPLQAPGGGENPPHGEDVAVFPLAIPLLAGPGALTTVLLLAARAQGEGSLDGPGRDTLPVRLAILVGVLVAVFALTYGIVLSGEWLLRKLGAGGIHIITRVMGVLLSALAVQFILNGVAGFVRSLAQNSSFLNS